MFSPCSASWTSWMNSLAKFSFGRLLKNYDWCSSRIFLEKLAYAICYLLFLVILSSFLIFLDVCFIYSVFSCYYWPLVFLLLSFLFLPTPNLGSRSKLLDLGLSEAQNSSTSSLFSFSFYYTESASLTMSSDSEAFSDFQSCSEPSFSSSGNAEVP